MNLAFLSQRIREIRKKRSFTLEELAERSQLTQSVLSKVENSRVTPSLAALSRIAAALGVTLSELVEGIDEDRTIMIMREGGAPTYEIDGATNSPELRSLAPTKHRKHFEPLLGLLESTSHWKKLPVERAETFLYMISGCLEVKSDGETCTLKKGDSVYLQAAELISIRNNGKTIANFFFIVAGSPA